MKQKLARWLHSAANVFDRNYQYIPLESPLNVIITEDCLTRLRSGKSEKLFPWLTVTYRREGKQPWERGDGCYISNR